MRASTWGAALLGVVGSAAAVTAAAPSAAAPPPGCRAAHGWVLAVPEPSPEKPTTQGAISGLVALGGGRYLAAHDAKLSYDVPGQPPTPRLHRLDVRRDGSVARVPVTWPGAQGDDVEALASLPGAPRDVLALQSSGAWFHLRLEACDTRVTVLARGALADPPPQVESLAVGCLGGRLVAVWAGRGAGATPAALRWGTLERDARGRVTALREQPGASLAVRAPWPDPTAPTTRHVSDLALTATGDLWAVSASDPGNAGPFDSATYRVGRLRALPCGFSVVPADAACGCVRFPGHKAEALVFTRCGPVYASDDENFGGWLLPH